MRILDVWYENITINDAIEKIIREIKNSDKKNEVFFLNADCLLKSRQDAEYFKILNQASFVLPDGVGLKIITRIFGMKMKENLVGTDFCPVLLERIARDNLKVFFLGGHSGVSGKAAENIVLKVKNLKIVGTFHGYFDDSSAVIDMINNSAADVLFVGMGVPAQEKWIFRNKDRLAPRLYLGVGALFDYWSGRIPRAPKIMRKFNLEWFWRLLIEPKRMFKRYIIGGFKLFLLVLKYKFKEIKSVKNRQTAV